MPRPARRNRRTGYPAAPGEFAGSLVAGVFGIVYVFVNSWPVPAGGLWAVRAVAIVLAAATAVSIIAGFLRTHRGAGAAQEAIRSGDARGEPRGLSRGYLLIVAAEVVALFGGLSVINNVFDAPHFGVAWVSVVVGAHFFPMARVLRLPFFRLIGALTGACGIAGLVSAAAQESGAAAAIVAGVVPGFVLLGFGLWGASRWWHRASYEPAGAGGERAAGPGEARGAGA